VPTPVEDFLFAIDRVWEGETATRIPLRVIGSTALMLQVDYVRGTKDSDVLKAASLTPEIQAHLLRLAGNGTPLATKHRMYLDLVPGGLPFLPLVPKWNKVDDLNRKLVHFQVEVLGIVDTVVSKLKRFSADDQADIKAMVDRDLVEHADLVERFLSAVDRFSGDARADDLPEFLNHLHQIERDLFFVAESEIDLPDWG
jgi:hypothetical protein